MFVPSEVNDAYKSEKSKHTVRLCEGVYVGFSMYMCIYVCLYCKEKKIDDIKLAIVVVAPN